jgi:hypothetical protein
MDLHCGNLLAVPHPAGEGFKKKNPDQEKIFPDQEKFFRIKKKIRSKNNSN